MPAVDEHPAGNLPLLAGPDVLEQGAATGRRAQQGAQLAAHAGLLQAGVGVGEVALVTQDQIAGTQLSLSGDLASLGGQPGGKADRDRASDRVPEHDRAVRHRGRAGG